MKTEKQDRRTRRTQRILREALISLILEKDYDRVTVQDIIDRADVGRSTFYAHFESKDKLLLSGFEDMQGVLQAAQNESETETADEIFNFDSLVIFRHADEHRRLYRALAGRSGGDLFLKQMFRQHNRIFRNNLLSGIEKTEKNKIQMEAAAHFFASSLVSMLTFWLDNNLPLSPVEMDKLFKQLTLPGIRKTLEI